tara:strand:- start:315 stop:731 length:417 start_codon:yes stop_codon:yes gene_type:complete
MALTWDVSKIKKAYRVLSKAEFYSKSDKIPIFSNPRYYDKDLDKYYEMNTETNMLIFICMFIGMSEITEKNFNKFYDRVKLYELINGSYLKTINPKTKKPKEKYFTLEDIKNHIGLKTNAENLNKTQYLKKTTQGWEL